MQGFGSRYQLFRVAFRVCWGGGGGGVGLGGVHLNPKPSTLNPKTAGLGVQGFRAPGSGDFGFRGFRGALMFRA